MDSQSGESDYSVWRVPFPTIPDKLVQPLREALPKLDQAISSSVPSEAVPLCQQLMHSWLLANQSRGGDERPAPPQQHVAIPPRAKTTTTTNKMATATMYSSPTPFSPRAYRQQQQQPLQQQQLHAHAPSVSKKGNAQRQWLPFYPRRKPTSVAPMYQSHHDELHAAGYHREGEREALAPQGQTGKKKNISDWPSNSHCSSNSNSTTSTTTTSASSGQLHAFGKQPPQKQENPRYKRSLSFFLSRLGAKVRHLLHPPQRTLPLSSAYTMPSLKSASVHPSASNHVFHTRLGQASTTNSDDTSTITAATPKMTEKTEKTEKTSTNKKTLSPLPVAMRDLSDSDDVDSIGPLTAMMDKNMLPPFAHSATQCTSTTTATGTTTASGPATYHPLTQKDATHSPLTFVHRDLLYDASALHAAPPPVAHLHDDDDDDDDDDHMDEEEDDDDDDDVDDDLHDDAHNLKTPWSPPESLTRLRPVPTSKTESAMNHELSVPFLKHGLASKIRRKSVDVDDLAQYTSHTASSTTFALQWQQKFHEKQQPRERIAMTLKSVAWSLYDTMRRNHRYQRFTSDTAYVAHPNLKPGDYNKALFDAKPVSEWRDIFHQMAYVFDKGEASEAFVPWKQLSAEHAIITMIYIDRMLENSRQQLCEVNWRLILLAGLITCVKVWDDCAVYNSDFVQIFPELDIHHVEMIERRFLEHIDWDVSVRCSLFASTYFELRDYQYQ